MKRFATLAAIAMLVACSEKEEAAAPAEAAATDATTMEAGAKAGGGVPGTYEATRPDGSKVLATLNADGTYERDMDGTVEKGTWVAKGNQTCFDPEGDAPESCNTRGPAAADGSFDSTNPAGEVSKVTPQS